MKILSIGNSFSQDAHRYLSRLAKAEGVEIETTNLYIGGCTLERHHANMQSGEAAYTLDLDGESTVNKSSLAEALAVGDWDVITLQQASHKSGLIDSYFPYLRELAAYVREACPRARLLLHETWAYEEGSERLRELGIFPTAKDMYKAASAAYAKAAEEIAADGIIPSGTAMMAATELGAPRVHRDTFHASYGLGRYILALTWYHALTGNGIAGNRFSGFDEPVGEEEREIAIRAVLSAFS